MIGANPFATVAELWSPLVLQISIVLMVLAVVIGTLFDVAHKGSAKFFAQRRERARASARIALSGTATVALVLRTIAEAAVSGSSASGHGAPPTC